MRLLNTRTLSLTEHAGDIPDYVILSHMWADGEVTFEDIDKPYAKDMPGYQKILGSCKLAINDGFDWIWIDTCCINKGSSAELSEAINSMYNWYWQAEICYAYLDDVPDDDEYLPSDHHFVSSRWFKRGWTLQELLAPAIVEFYGQNWKPIGTRSSLIRSIERATQIDTKHLLDRESVHDASLSAIFSWASRRETKRLEDMAYCLLGLVRVNMPLIYGEGQRAFYRLQLELLKQTTDHTMFAWNSFPGDVFETTGILAPSPRHFEFAADIRRAPYPRSIAVNSIYTTYEMTNRGLRIALPRIRDGKEFVAVLNCRAKDGNFVGIRLVEDGREQYRRVPGSKTWNVPTRDVFGNYPSAMYISAESRLKIVTPLERSRCSIRIGKMNIKHSNFRLQGVAVRRGQNVDIYENPEDIWVFDQLNIHSNEYASFHFGNGKTTFGIVFGQFQGQTFFEIYPSAKFRWAEPILTKLAEKLQSNIRPENVRDRMKTVIDPNVRLELFAKKSRVTGTESGLCWKLTIEVCEEAWGTPSEDTSVLERRLALTGI